MEAVNISRVEGTEFVANDLTRAKNGMRLDGITVIRDKENLIEKALDRFHAEINREADSSVSSLMNKLKSTPKIDIPEDPLARLASFVETMKKAKIYGNEFAHVFVNANRGNLFGEKMKTIFLGEEREQKNGQKLYSRHICVFLPLKDKNDNKKISESTPVYLIDTNDFDNSSVYTYDKIVERVAKKELVEEGRNHSLPKINKEVE